MATQAEKLLRIEHPDTGTRYSVTEHDYKHRKMAALHGQTYAEAGYDVVSYEDGTPYGGDAEPSKYAVASERAVQPIGEGDGHTSIDGAALTDAQKRDAIIVGAMGPETVAPITATRRARTNGDHTAPAPPASAPAATTNE